MTQDAAAVSGKMPPLVLGMVLFIASEMMFFGGLFAAFFALRDNAGQWPPAGTGEPDLVLGGVMTLVLLVSSVTQHRAAAAAARNDGRSARQYLWITVTLGALFLGAQLWETAHLPFSVATNAFGTTFGTITGFHGLHVLGGLVMLVLASAQVRRGAAHKGGVEAATLYWHFVDAVWVTLFLTLYLPSA